MFSNVGWFVLLSILDDLHLLELFFDTLFPASDHDLQAVSMLRGEDGDTRSAPESFQV